MIKLMTMSLDILTFMFKVAVSKENDLLYIQYLVYLV